LVVLPPPVEAPYWATVREIGQGLHQRMPRLLGRDTELALLSAFALGPPGYMCWRGGAYAGKSALLYELVTSGVLPDAVVVIAYFVRARSFDADEGRFLNAVVPQLELLCEEPSQPRTLDRFHQLWQRACAGDRPVLLVVDALDEDWRPSGSAPIAARLPTLLGARGHVLVTSRPHPEVRTWVEPGHPLASCPSIDLAPFEGSAELAEQARAEIDAIARGPDVDILALLTAAGGPLSEVDLAALTVFPQPPTAVTRRRVRDLVASARTARSLEPVGSLEVPRYQFAHDLLVQHARAHPNLADPEYRQTIHAWVEQRQVQGWPTPDAYGGGTPRYLLDAYPATLFGDPGHPALFPAEPDRHAKLLTDLGWLDSAIRTLGVDQVRAALERAPHSARIRQVRDVLGAQALNLGPWMLAKDPGMVVRQFCLQALWFGMDDLAHQCAERLRSRGGDAVPVWSSNRSAAPPDLELGRHDSSVFTVGVLPDGRVVSGGHDHRVRVWDPAHPGSPLELGRHDGSVRAVAVLSDGRVVSGGDDHRVRVWDPAHPGSPLELGSHNDARVTAVAVLPDGRVVSLGHDHRVRAWDLAHPGTSLPLSGWMDVVAVLPDGHLVSGNANGQVLIWDPGHPSKPIQLGRHDYLGVSALAILADGRVVSGGEDRRVRVWDPAHPGVERHGYHDSRASAMVGLPDGRMAVGGADGRVRVWDPAQPSIWSELGRHDGGVWAVAVLPDGRVVSGGDDDRVRVWDPTRPGTPLEQGRNARVRAVAVLPDGRVVSGGDDYRVLVWDPAHPGTAIELGRHDGRVWALAVLPNGRVISCDIDGRVRVWDPAHPGTSIELGTHDLAVRTVAVLPDGRVVSGGDDHRIRVWDPGRPSAPIELGTHDLAVRTVAVLPDGRVVSGGDDHRIRVWDPAHPGTPLELGNQDQSRVSAVAVLPDGRVVSGGDDRRVRVWDAVRCGNSIAEISLDSQVRAITAKPRTPWLVGIATEAGTTLLSFSGPNDSLDGRAQ